MGETKLQAVLGHPLDIKVLMDRFSHYDAFPINFKLFILDAWFFYKKAEPHILSCAFFPLEMLSSAALFDFDVLADEILSYLATKVIFEKLPISWFLTGLAAYLHDMPILTANTRLYNVWKVAGIELISVEDFVGRLT